MAAVALLGLTHHILVSLPWDFSGIYGNMTDGKTWLKILAHKLTNGEFCFGLSWGDSPLTILLMSRCEVVRIDPNERCRV